MAQSNGKPAFSRVLLKLSGEALLGDLAYGVEPERLHAIARTVKRVSERGVEVAIVVGGGNIYRGLEGTAHGMDRASADYMGMLATVLNALALQDALEHEGVQHARAVGDHDLRRSREPYIRRRAMRHLEKGRVVIFAARHRQPVLHDRHGGGAAGARDPRGGDTDGEEQRRGRLRHGPERARGRDLPAEHHPPRGDRARAAVMDSTALSLCKDNGLPIYVFNMSDESNIDRIVCGERVGTLVAT